MMRLYYMWALLVR